MRAVGILEQGQIHEGGRETGGITVEVALGAPGGGVCQGCGSMATAQ